MIVTQGTEIVDSGIENLRAITGAAGDYSNLRGGVFQTLLGFNEHMAVNATFRIEDPEFAKSEHDPSHSRFGAEDTSIDASDHAHPSGEKHLEIEWDSGVPVGGESSH